MNKLILKCIALVFFSLFLANINHTFSQCNNGTNFYPSALQTPPLGTWWSATSFNYAGEIIRVDVNAGDIYEFSTCSNYGGVSATYDTQLTLTDVSGNVLDFNDDYTGCGTASYINWLATFSGEVYLHINEYNCVSNFTSTEVMIQRTTGSLCNTPTTTITQTCFPNLTYDIDIVVSALGDAPSVDINDGTNTYFSSVGTGTYQITGFTNPTAINVVSTSDATCFISQSFPSCNSCGSTSSPSDEPCNAPSVDLSQPFYGSTDCGYTVTSGGMSPGPDNFCGGANNDSWLKFTAAADTVILDWTVIYDPANGCDDGVQFSVFDGSCFNQDGMVELACFNPSGGFQGTGTFNIPDGSFGSYPLTIGQEYFIYIDGYAGDLCDYYWNPQSGVAITPPNDSCDNAIVITCGSVDTSNNILASNNDAPPSCGGLTPGTGVWYKYIGDGSDVTLSTASNGTNFDTEIFVYQGPCFSLSCIGSDNNSGSGTTSEITFTTVVGTEYLIYVDGNGTSAGQFVLSATCLSCNANAGSWN